MVVTVLDIVKPVIDQLQHMLEERLAKLSPETSSCSHTFLSIIDELEQFSDEKLLPLGWKRVNVATRSEDLVIAAYLVETAVLEIGIKGFNKCAPIGELARTHGVRVYARLHSPGAGVLGEVYAESRAEEKGRTIYIY